MNNVDSENNLLFYHAILYLQRHPGLHLDTYMELQIVQGLKKKQTSLQ